MNPLAYLTLVSAVSYPNYAFVQNIDIDKISTIFIDALVARYGTNDRLSSTEFATLVESLSKNKKRHVEVDLPNITNVVLTEYEYHCNTTEHKDCNEYISKHCLDYDTIFRIFSNDDRLNPENLRQAFPSLVFSLQNEVCNKPTKANAGTLLRRKPSLAETWGYSFGFVLFINLISNIGACLGPFMKTAIFQEILMFCVALSVGTLSGTGFLILIPESLGLTGENSPIPNYIWKAVVVMAGIYFFYITEMIMAFITLGTKQKNKTSDDTYTVPQKEKDDGTEDILLVHGHSHGASKDGVDPVAWMLLCGDSLHKFVDGLSIGAAFTENILTGLSVSVAIICEEFPHELGDIAVLLNAGLNIKKALIYNLLAAVVGFAGLIVGVFMGETTGANYWIFAMAGGFFIYVSLVDLIPEMTSKAKEMAKINRKKSLKIYMLQSIGMLLGFLVILMLALFTSDIKF